MIMEAPVLVIDVIHRLVASLALIESNQSQSSLKSLSTQMGIY